MLEVIKKLIAEMEYSEQLLVKQYAEDNNLDSAELMSLINAVCAELRLNKYDKVIKQFIIRDIGKVKLKKPKREARRVTSFNALLEFNL